MFTKRLKKKSTDLPTENQPGQQNSCFTVENKCYSNYRIDKQNVKKINYENEIIYKKLQNIKRRPPATYHAPNGFKSLSKKSKKIKFNVRESFMQGNETCLPPCAWPPRPHSAPHRKFREKVKIDFENQQLNQALKKYNQSFDEVARKHAGIPKTLGVVVCANCGTKSAPKNTTKVGQTKENKYKNYTKQINQLNFCKKNYSQNKFDQNLEKFNQNLTKLNINQNICEGNIKNQPLQFSGSTKNKYNFQNNNNSSTTKKFILCDKCNKTYYCCELCKKLDWDNHRLDCHFQKFGHWMPSGGKPEKNYWVNNRGLSECRRMIKYGLLNKYDSEAWVNAIRVIEALNLEVYYEQRTQEFIEQLAYDGRDGPRPCLYSGGKYLC